MVSVRGMGIRGLKQQTGGPCGLSGLEGVEVRRSVVRHAGGQDYPRAWDSLVRALELRQRRNSGTTDGVVRTAALHSGSTARWQRA